MNCIQCAAEAMLVPCLDEKFDDGLDVVGTSKVDLVLRSLVSHTQYPDEGELIFSKKESRNC